MWTAKWASQSVRKIDKKFAPNCFLYLNAPQTVPLLKKNLEPLKDPPFVWPYCQHTKKFKKSKHGFLLSISILVYRAKFTGDLKNSNLVVLALKKNCTYIPPLKPTKNKSSFGKFNSPSTKVHLLTSRPRCCGHELTSLEWSKLHTFISTTTGGAYKPKMSPFYVTFARQLCDDTHLPGWV